VPGLANEIGDLGIYCFDNAIFYFIGVIENALGETEKIGIAPNVEHVAKYTLEQLLADDFRLPRPPTANEKRKQTGQQVKAIFGAGKPRRKGKGKGKGKEQPKVSPLMQKWLQRHPSKAA
jgi:hypothetical protein